MQSSINFILALSPIIIVLVLMIGFHWSGSRAGAMGWLAAFGVAYFVFGADVEILAYSQTKGILLSIYVLYIIWMALVLYNVVNEAGGISTIAGGIVRLTTNPVLQLLILSWVFSSFLQGVAGFGVPIAVVAPLLIGLGFPPVTAVASVAIGHSWSVTFGDISSSYNALIAASGLSGEVLAPWVAIMLGVACFCCGIAAAHTYQGWKTVKQGFLAIFIVGIVMSITQYYLATNGLWSLAGFVAGMTGLVASVIVVRLPFYNNGESNVKDSVGKRMKQPQFSPKLITDPKQSLPLYLSVLPYLLLIIIVVCTELIKPLKLFLNEIMLTMMFPKTTTALGWIVEAEIGKSISLFGHPGALIAYTSIISFLLFWSLGIYRFKDVKVILSKTSRNAIHSSIGIVTMVGFALIMEQSGMTYTIAEGLSNVLEPIYPLISPFIGLLGAFMTGSNTNSNVVFTALQQQTSNLLGLIVPIILAAQTTGGSLGSMLAPAKIIVGCSTAGLSGEEGQVLRKTIVYGLIITTIIGLITWIAV